ncbi:signal peptide peptidase-like 2 [Musa acuminata AAA Group]|uniref:signal peptide peptidase-like 2 n=1 Tax=Musa acuminata AAA Group TaxID=214697 RepID=UPI0031DEE0CB
MTIPRSSPSLPLLHFALVFLFASSHLKGFAAGDASQGGESASTSPGCNVTSQDVKIKNWVNGDESASLDGLSARFGASLPTSVSKALRLPAILANPFNSCNKLSSKLSNSFVVAERGNCTYATKAEIAESSGAAGLMVINDDEDLTEMVCTKNETHLNITIPVVMIPKSAGDYLRRSMSSGGKVDILLYSPTRPILDISVVFLVLMAVGTIVSASFWDEFTAHEQDQPSAETNQEDSEKNTLKIKAVGAIAFVIVASAFLVVLFFFMSSSFVFALNVIFSLAGSQGMHFCIVSLISRASKRCRQMKINIPILGKVSVIAIVVLPFCIAFSIIWVGNRHSPHAWIGQDILGITLMITVLQVLELPNIKVASILLCCAFFYDIFWVFLSPLIFHQSVMIAVATGHKAGGESIPMLLKIPRFFDPWGGYQMIGFGDIILPGLLIVFSHRFDKLTKKGISNGYFLWLIFGYTFGLSVTYLVFYLMNGHGQPALLYLVPCTLGLTVVLGGLRGEIGDLWNYGETPSKVVPGGET